MSIADNLKRISDAKASIRESIENKGVSVPDEALLNEYPALIDSIEVGGGSDENNPYQQLYMQRTANETSMVGLFAYTPASTTLDLSAMNTSKVTDMSYMFNYCNTPYLDLSGFDVSNVNNMSYMFYDCDSEINIDGWDTSKLTNTSSMFGYFTNNNKYLDLSVLDFSNVTKVQNMFNSCNIDYVDIRNINIDLTKLDWNGYSGPEFLNSVTGTTLDLSNWTLDSSITSLKKLLYYARCTEINLTNWKTTNITNMDSMFYYNSNLVRLIIPDWDMTNTTNTSQFFYQCTKLNYIDLSRSNDTTIAKMATLVPAKTLAAYGQMIIPADSSQANINALAAKYWKPVGPRIDITSCEIITELDEIKPGKSTKLYYGNSEPWYGNDYNVEYVSSDESVATIDKENMIVVSTGVEGTTEITARNKETQEVISEPFSFSVSETDNYPNVVKIRITGTPSSYNDVITINGTGTTISKLTYNRAFDTYTYDAGKTITSIKFHKNYLKEIVKLNTSNITSMNQMFISCENLTSLDLSDFDTSNVTNMYMMFRYCENLISLEGLNNWDISNVTDMSNMFQYCNSLTSLDLSNWDISNVTNKAGMFNDCPSLIDFKAPKNINDYMDISASTKLTHESLMSIINNLATITLRITLTLGPTNLAKLTDEEIAIATQKGWTVK
jgi:surface protein